MAQPNHEELARRLADAPDLAVDATESAPRRYRFLGLLHRYGSELVALRTGEAGALYLFVRKEDVADIAPSVRDPTGCEVELVVFGDARCFLAEAQSVDGIIDLLNRRRLATGSVVTATASAIAGSLTRGAVSGTGSGAATSGALATAPMSTNSTGVTSGWSGDTCQARASPTDSAASNSAWPSTASPMAPRSVTPPAHALAGSPTPPG